MAAVLPNSTSGVVAPEVWDRLVGRNFYSSSGWLSFTGSEPGAVSSAVTSWANGELRAAVPVAELTAAPMPLYRWNDLLAGYGLPLLSPRGLLVGPRQGYQTHFLVSETEPAQPLIAEMIDELRQLSAGGEGACVAMYVTTRDALAIRNAGVTAPPVLLEADAWFQVHPDGWDAWLDSQPRNRRAKVRKEDRQFREAGYLIYHRPLADCYEQLAVAAAATQSKYGNTDDPEYYLRSLRRYVEGIGKSAQVALCAYQEGDPVGFCIYFHWGDTIFLRWSGFDYTRLCGAAEYFNLLYYHQLERAPELGVRWIHAGIKSAQAKARRGARLQPLWMVDLTPRSVLTEAAEKIREHNNLTYQTMTEDSQTAAALVDVESWSAFR